MTTPKQRYCSDLKREGFVADKAQKQAVDHLDALYFRLVARSPQSFSIPWQRIQLGNRQ